MSRSTGCSAPAGAERQRSTSVSVARTKVGTKPSSSWWRNSGAEAWRCHFHSAPSLVRMPVLSSGESRRICDSLRYLSRSSSRTDLTSAGPVTQSRCMPPTALTETSSSYTACGTASSGLRRKADRKARPFSGFAGGWMRGGIIARAGLFIEVGFRLLLSLSREETTMQRSILAVIALTLALPVLAQAPARPPIQTTTVEGTDGVYIFRNVNHQSIFIVTSDGVIATDPIAYGKLTGGADYVAEIRKVI